ncbi:DinB/UmuC family translesion DNA polymerase [Mucilaginibacter sp.]
MTRNKSFHSPVADLETISATAKQLLAATNPQDKKIRLLGVSLSNFGDITKTTIEKPSDQLKLFIL